jgi:hypothetical protein
MSVKMGAVQFHKHFDIFICMLETCHYTALFSFLILDPEYPNRTDYPRPRIPTHEPEVNPERMILDLEYKILDPEYPSI